MEVENYDASKREWYKTAIGGNGKIVRTKPYFDVALNSLITSNLRSFTDKNGKLLGVIGIGIQQSIISDTLNKMKTGKTGFFMLVHNTGIIMADGSNPKNNFKKIEDVKIQGLNQILSNNSKGISVVIDGKKYLVN